MEKKLRKRFIIVGIVLILVFGGLIAYHFVVQILTARYMAQYQPAPATVSVFKVEPVKWNPTYSTVGSTVAVQGTSISPIVAGQVTKILFNSGDVVEKGQILAVMDIDVLTAQLANAKATLNYDKKTYERDQALYHEGVLSAASLDQSRSTYQASAATVAQDGALLGQKYILAPFAGRVGIRMVSVGQYLNPGDVVTNIQQLNPIYVNFELPEQFLQQMYIGQAVGITVDTFPGQVFNGKISAFDAAVGDNTKSITVQATFTNTDSKALLLPGMQANITVYLRSNGDVLALPQEAINYSLYGNNVYVVVDSKDKQGNPQKIATQVAVTSGAQEGDLVAVTGGLKAGDLVVVDGTAKIQANNSPVTIVSEVSGS